VSMWEGNGEASQTQWLTHSRATHLTKLFVSGVVLGLHKLGWGGG
jgi:hypothetical protein